MEKAVASWLALAKHIIPEDDIRAQFIGWLAHAVDRDAPSPKQIAVLRTRQGVGKTLLLQPFIRAGNAAPYSAAETLSLSNAELVKAKGLAVVDDYSSFNPDHLFGVRRVGNGYKGRVLVLSTWIHLSEESLDATGAYWVYDSRAERLPQEYYARYIEALEGVDPAAVVTGILNQ
jgi:hypothetical protein